MLLDDLCWEQDGSSTSILPLMDLCQLEWSGMSEVMEHVPINISVLDGCWPRMYTSVGKVEYEMKE